MNILCSNEEEFDKNHPVFDKDKTYDHINSVHKYQYSQVY